MPDLPPRVEIATGAFQAAEILDRVANYLPSNGYDDPRRDARHLLALAMERSDAIFPHEDIVLEDHMIGSLATLIDRRRQGEPISRIRGWREFYGLNFFINPSTLDPRPDSEVVVDTVLDYARDREERPVRLVDFGTGSGCLLLAAAAQLPTATGIGVDIQDEAIAMASYNAVSLGLADRITFKQGSWDEKLEGSFDIIICNPPYIPQGKLSSLMDEVKNYDPIAALDGGPDGLAAWRQLAPIFKGKLSEDGIVVVEIGVGQQNDVATLMEASNLKLIEQRRDIAGIIRTLVFSHF
jgi:release factor glutamine methyltransferase